MLLALVMILSMLFSSQSVLAASVDSGLNGAGSITINKLADPYPGTIKVTGNGYMYQLDSSGNIQYIDAKGQVLVDQTLPVKFDPSTYAPLEGISFDIYVAKLYVNDGTVSITPPGAKPINGVPPTDNNGSNYYFTAQTYLADPTHPEYYLIGNYIGSGLTDANGQLTFDKLIVGTEGNEVAYYIVENNANSTNKMVKTMVNPFVIPLPMDDDLNPSTPQQSNINVYPKNALDNPRKQVGTIDPANPNVIPYILQADIPPTVITSTTPADIKLTDTLDPRLVLLSSSLTIELIDKNGVGLAIDVSDYFTVTQPDDLNNNMLTVECTTGTGPSRQGVQAFIQKQAVIDAIGSTSSTYCLQVTFDTKLAPGTDSTTVVNQAILNYQDSNVTINNSSDALKAFVNLLKIDITKIDPMQSGTDGKPIPLQGAEFVLYTNKADADAAVLYYTGESTTVPQDSLRAADGSKITATSGADGTATFDSPVALIQDTYYLVETIAPTHYNLLGAPIVLPVVTDTSSTTGYSYSATLGDESLVIDSTNVNRDDAIGSQTVKIFDDKGVCTLQTITTDSYSVSINDIPNRLEVQLPLAGGLGNLGLMIGFGFVIVAGFLTVVLVLNRRKKIA